MDFLIHLFVWLVFDAILGQNKKSGAIVAGIVIAIGLLSTIIR